VGLADAALALDDDAERSGAVGGDGADAAADEGRRHRVEAVDVVALVGPDVVEGAGPVEGEPG
jgi:hypothetical protein